MLATETRVQVSILGYLSSDLKEAVGGRQDSGVRIQDSGVRRQETGDYFYLLSPHPTPHTPLPHFPELSLKHTQPYKQRKTKLLL